MFVILILIEITDWQCLKSLFVLPIVVGENHLGLSAKISSVNFLSMLYTKLSALLP